VFTWVQERLACEGPLKGRTVAIDGTTSEANAAMRSIVRRDTGASYDEFLRSLAEASGIKRPSREALVRLDRRRLKKTSNEDWTSPADPDARVTKMKDKRTHLAHKAETAVDTETGAIVAVTIQCADQGDTTTIKKTLAEAVKQVETLMVSRCAAPYVSEEGWPKSSRTGATTATRPCSNWRIWISVRTSRNQRGRAGSGRTSSRRRRPRFMRIAVGCVVRAECAYDANVGNERSGRLPTSARPATCGGRTCAGTTTS